MNIFVKYGATFTPKMTNIAIINVSIPAFILNSFIKNAAPKSVIMQNARAPHKPYLPNTKTITKTNGTDITEPNSAV